MADDRIKKSLHYSLIDGIFASIMVGFSETFITPYALAMKASAGLVGILSSMPNLVGSFFQMKAAPLSERLGSRKALFTKAVLIHALMWVPIMLIPYLFRDGRVIFLIIFYTFFASFNVLSFPAWSSMMADLVPETERGRVFGWRNRLFGTIGIVSMFTAGLILSAFHRLQNQSLDGASVFFGFTVIFFIAFIARLISWRFLTKMYEPPLVIKDEHRFTFLNFLKRVQKTNFGRFAIFVAAMNFSVNIASPFFAVYMLRDLGFSYLTYTIVTMAATATILLTINSWGLHADHVGNRKILRLTSIFIPFVPVLWLFSHNVLYLIVIQIVAGFFWAGFNLSASNFIYDAVTPEKRTRCIAYFNVINGFALFSGAALGGYLINILPQLSGHRILTLFLVSGILRLCASVLCSFVKEVRKVKEISGGELFYSVIGIRPALSLLNGKE